MIPSEIYERDPTEYVASFDKYLSAWQGNDDERDLTAWVTVSAVGAEDEWAFRLVALGYVSAEWEYWSETLGQEPLGLFENMRAKSDRECAERDIPEELFPLIYGTNIMTARFVSGEMAAYSDETLGERLTLLWDAFVMPNTTFETAPTVNELEELRSLFDTGVGLNLFLRWHMAMEERGVPEEDRWADLALAPIYDDRLASLDLPKNMRGCKLDRSDTFGYEIQSPGKLGGYHMTSFLAEGNTANITQFVISGRFGTRPFKTIQPSHADVLRDLGFQEAVFPNGQRYRLSSWGGFSGIRKVKD